MNSKNLFRKQVVFCSKVLMLNEFSFFMFNKSLFKSAIEQRKLCFWIIICSKAKASTWSTLEPTKQNTFEQNKFVQTAKSCSKAEFYQFKSTFEQRRLYFWTNCCSKAKFYLFNSTFEERNLYFWTNNYSKVKFSLFNCTFEQTITFEQTKLVLFQYNVIFTTIKT